MPSPTSVTEPRTITPVGPAFAEPTLVGTAVLDRVAARVRQRLEAEEGATGRVGDGAHAASLIWPWPL
ncbi:HaaA family cyclophane-containing RiPP peptide [Streptomyces cavernae]|uniref:HaaA family cyclophane-containing RiPP peptide n=1 Tax=Streptomyces cavernae TaxID=2259034 RepID=UPI000FEB9E65|nr:HaaA family cyclophane-containing RiPP peptide [Streptomyces cavernae]